MLVILPLHIDSSATNRVLLLVSSNSNIFALCEVVIVGYRRSSSCFIAGRREVQISLQICPSFKWRYRCRGVELNNLLVEYTEEEAHWLWALFLAAIRIRLDAIGTFDRCFMGKKFSAVAS